MPSADENLLAHINWSDLLFSPRLASLGPMGIVVFDRDLRLLRFNPTFAEFVMRQAPQSAGKLAPGARFFDVDPSAEAAVRPLLQRALAGERVRVDAFLITAAGVDRYWDAVLTPLVQAGQVVGVLGAIADATDRARAEREQQQVLAALQQSDAHWRSLLESAAGFALFRVAGDPGEPHGGRVVAVSPSLRDLAGIDDPHDFRAWFRTLHPDDQPRVAAANRRAWELGLPYDETARYFNGHTQVWKRLRTIANPVRDASGRVGYLNGLVVDVTAQTAAEGGP